MSEEHEEIKVKFIYKKSDDYKQFYANGAYGGLTPHGDVFCNFFFESRDMPQSQDAVIKDEKVTVLDESDPSRQEILREVKCALILRPDRARSIAEWLQKRADEYDEKFKKE